MYAIGIQNIDISFYLEEGMVDGLSEKCPWLGSRHATAYIVKKLLEQMQERWFSCFLLACILGIVNKSDTRQLLIILAKHEQKTLQKTFFQGKETGRC